jgi:hypothetical protein
MLNKPVLRRLLEPGLTASVAVEYQARIEVRMALQPSHPKRVNDELA